MNNRERTLAILNYQDYDAVPCVAFGYWDETLTKWLAEGYITPEDMAVYKGDSSEGDKRIMKKLGFDFNWSCRYSGSYGLQPGFGDELLETYPNGQQLRRNGDGLLVKVKPGLTTIPSEVGTSLTDREAWEKLYLPKLQFCAERYANADKLTALPPLQQEETPRGLHVGSYIGVMRNLLGVEHFSYLLADDFDLYVEIIDTLCGLAYQVVEAILKKTGPIFDYALFWEDICFKNGPLVIPSIFDEYVGPHYKKVTDLLKSYNIHIVSLDCDGCIDALIPTWLQNGVNTMFPIEVGTWNASIGPWREKYGRELRGVGGMDKRVFGFDYAAIDAEIERLKPLVALGGYIPCPDHRIPPDAKFENVQYYCERFKETFSK